MSVTSNTKVIQKDAIIIGGGPAAASSAIYLHTDDSVMLVGPEPGGQLNKAHIVDNYLGFINVKGIELAEAFLSHASNHTKIIYETVKKIELKNHLKYVYTDENVYVSNVVIIATGSTPKKLNKPGESRLNNLGISYCAICDGILYKNKTVAVIGGGNSAFSEVIYLSNICKKIYLIHRGDKNSFRSFTNLQKEVYDLVKEGKVELILESEIYEFAGDKELEYIDVKNKNNYLTKIEVAGAFIAIGHKPNTDFCPNEIKKNEEGCIVVDREHRVIDTHNQIIKGIYACGDLVIFNDGEYPLKQAITAANSGTIAALDIMNKKLIIKKNKT